LALVLHPDLHLPLTEIAAICRAYQVRELALFGSATRDDFGPASDLDFLVEFAPDAEIGFMELAGLQFALEDATGRSVDVVSKAGLKPLIRDAVLADARTVYAT